jgi:hypothetical protein
LGGSHVKSIQFNSEGKDSLKSAFKLHPINGSARLGDVKCGVRNAELGTGSPPSP